MSKIGRNKKSCEKYKLSGRKVENKAIKQAKHEKRMTKFAKRKEEGKAYEYTPVPFVKGSKEYNRESAVRAEKNVSRKTPLQNMTSIMRKLENQLAKERVARKEFIDKKKSRVKTA